MYKFIYLSVIIPSVSLIALQPAAAHHNAFCVSFEMADLDESLELSEFEWDYAGGDPNDFGVADLDADSSITRFEHQFFCEEHT